MGKPKIIRLWGTADSFDIEFSNEGDTTWKVDVPPDLTDGVYAVHLTAVNELGEYATWTGELFMCGGACCVTFKEAPFQMWFKVSVYTVKFSQKYSVEVKKSAKPMYTAKFDTVLKMTFNKKRCNHV